MKLTSSLRLCGLGIVLGAALFACAFKGASAWSFFIPIGIAVLAYLLALREFVRVPAFPRHVVFVCLALAILWRVPLLMTPVAVDDDIDRYVWDGRVQRLGYNPYTLVPADPALAGLHTNETRGMNNASVPSPYPAGAQLFFRAVTAIHESARAFKVAFVLCDLAIILVLYVALRQLGKGEHWILAYAWHPLLATEVAGSGHVDIVGVLLLLVSAVALGRRWRTIAAITFALACAVKFLPLVLIPLYWRRLRVRHGVLAAIVFGVLYLPFLKGGRVPLGSLGTTSCSTSALTTRSLARLSTLPSRICWSLWRFWSG